MIQHILFVPMLLLAVSSCMQTDSEQPATDGTATDSGIQTFVYECPDDFSFIARVEQDKAWLFLPGRTIDLPRVETDTGASYTSGNDTFRYDGEQAALATGAIKHTGCINNRASAIWEHAKLNGVDFRATGNEPGWYMEISNSEDIMLVTDYGNSRYRFTASNIKSEPHSRTTVYNARSNDDLLEVVITGQPCRDSMSGEAFPASVAVRLNDRRYSGCGKALH